MRCGISRRCKTKILSLQRRVAIRMVRGYRTISFEAATLLACFPPLYILAERDARVYDQTRALRRRRRKCVLPCQRSRSAQAAGAKKGTHDVVRPSPRRSVLTGHGCFGEYLCRIGLEATAVCHHCGADQDDAQHTLEACPAWTAERQVLVQQIGRNLSLRAVVSAMLRRESAWEAVVNFCETVMVQKETVGRARERADPARRRRPAGRLTASKPQCPGRNK
ncbi:uncharacterized protein LOC124534200 [Vanessa cardui]|uniref:uncharacterized protein LOC124534200 n=1 Tax=Vanessa cardui TaxID=171605 RepID=UPI001F131E33|nr:uncharacterized protein LOC124534200 [Vanessa cardui]